MMTVVRSPSPFIFAILLPSLPDDGSVLGVPWSVRTKTVTGVSFGFSRRASRRIFFGFERNSRLRPLLTKDPRRTSLIRSQFSQGWRSMGVKRKYHFPCCTHERCTILFFPPPPEFVSLSFLSTMRSLSSGLITLFLRSHVLSCNGRFSRV